MWHHEFHYYFQESSGRLLMAIIVSNDKNAFFCIHLNYFFCTWINFLHDYFIVYLHLLYMVIIDFKIYPNLIRPQLIYISIIPNRSHFQIKITIMSTKGYDLSLPTKHITPTICGILVNNIIAGTRIILAFG